MPVTRTITIKDAKIKKLLEQRDVEVKKGRELEKQKQTIEQEQRKIGLLLNRIKEKVTPMVNAHAKKESFNPYEVISAVQITDGQVVMTVTDSLELWKENYGKKK